MPKKKRSSHSAKCGGCGANTAPYDRQYCVKCGTLNRNFTGSSGACTDDVDKCRAAIVMLERSAPIDGDPADVMSFLLRKDIHYCPNCGKQVVGTA